MDELIIPTKIYSGEDSLNVLSSFRNMDILMVCDSFLPGTDNLKKIEAHLKGNSVEIFSDVKPDPPLDNIMKGVDVFIAKKPDVVIAIGGGSAIDTAKAIRFFGEKLTNKEVACFVAIPTTSGTGSEVTNTSVISDTKNGVKFPLIRAHLIPDIAILEPTLVMSAPASVTAFSGLDVLTHALEALVSKDANLFTDALAEKAIQVITNQLVDTYKDGQNVELRKAVHEASCSAGLAFNTAGLGICHSIAHQLGAKFHVPHGLANAMLLPYVVEFNAQDPDVCRKYAEAATKAGIGPSTLSDKLLVKRIQKKIFSMMRDMKCPMTLKEFGINPSDVQKEMDWLVSHAKADGTYPGNPIEPTDEDLKQIIKKVMA